ncbi:MAG: hypothetical protein HY282_17860 [Nitrospirae bacterium]|nr:hypothetical protein [Candidatus Manganitrophaceae bacterium]
MVSNQKRRDKGRSLLGGLGLISLAGFLVTLPHAVEDFVYGVPQKYGVGLSVAGFLLAVGYFVQVYGIILLMSERPAGRWITLMIGFTWLAGASWDHLLDLFSAEPYRQGAISRTWIAGIFLWSMTVVSASLFLLYSAYSARRLK